MKYFGLQVLLVVMILLAYSNCFSGPFVFDDNLWILENPHIKKIWPIWETAGFSGKHYPSDLFGSLGRPVFHLSLALNYVISGRQVWSYHCFNLIIHLLNALVLFSLVRHIFLQTPPKNPNPSLAILGDTPHRGDPLSAGPPSTAGIFPEVLARRALELAFCCTLIWALHPMQTMPVNYISQRCESMMTLFFLLTFYCSILNRTGWALAFFLLGVGSKEIIAVAPPVVFLYQFCSSKLSVREILRSSRRLYFGFLIGLIILGLQIHFVGKTPALIATPQMENSWHQGRILGHYVRLFFWPDMLCFDYFGWPGVEKSQAVPYLLLIAALLMLSLCFIRKRNPLAFACLSFFGILAPTILLPRTEKMCEYRFYLPSAFLVVATISVLCIAAGGLKNVFPRFRPFFFPMGIAGTAVLAAMLGFLTFSRNITYQNAVSLWSDALEKAPYNWRAAGEAGLALKVSGKFRESLLFFERSLALNPLYPYSHSNLGDLYSQLGNPKEAFFHLQEAVRLKPDFPQAYLNLGIAFLRVKDEKSALKNFETAVLLKPDYADAWFDLGLYYETSAGDPARALENFRKARHFNPDDAEAGKRIDLLLTKFPALNNNL